MAEKNIEMKKKNADGTFDTYFPLTKANNVKMADEETVENKITSHLADNMPHQFTDSGTQTTYKWGLSVVDGKVTFNYEEVIV